MKLCIVSSILEPDAGGPATYAPRLAQGLVERGYNVKLIAYSDRLSYPQDEKYNFELRRILRRGTYSNAVRMFFTLLRELPRFDLVYSFDWYGIGLPLAVASFITRTPFVVRVGGDYAWDQKYIESAAAPLTLKAFYEQGVYLRGAYRIMFYITRFVLHRAERVVFNTDIQKDLYVQYFGLDPRMVSVIYNPVPVVDQGIARRDHVSEEIVFMGRFVGMKNIPLLIRAFAQAKLPHSYRLLLIGDGPRKAEIEQLVKDLNLGERTTIMPLMRQQQLFERVANCRAFVLPSWTDISPNNVYEALAIGLPCIVTKENFLSVHDSLPVTIDPYSVEDLVLKLEMLADEDAYRSFSERFAAIRFQHTWDDVVRQHEAVYKAV